jgi:hypothetical protein
MTSPLRKACIPTTAARVCALLVAALLLLQPIASLHAEEAADGAPPQDLQIVILDGEGALNNIQARTAREPIVQVQDHNHKPVAGASVLFAIHGGSAGAGGTFAEGATSLSVTTGTDGIAHAAGLLPNGEKGAWQITVSASYGALTASTIINEINFTPLPPAPPQSTTTTFTPHPFHWPFPKPITIAGGIIIVGAIIAITVIETNNSNSTKITPGNPTVGPPGGGSTAVGGIQIRF